MESFPFTVFRREDVLRETDGMKNDELSSKAGRRAHMEQTSS